MSLTGKTNHQIYEHLAEDLLALNPEVRHCLLIAFPQGSLLASREPGNDRYHFPKIHEGTVGMVSRWLVSTLVGFGRANEETSELEYVAIERKLHRLLFFKWKHHSTDTVITLGLTKEGDIAEIYSKAVKLLMTS